MSQSVMQTSFAGGEFSPALYARTDLTKYESAVRLMRNAYPSPQGSVSNRGGLEFIGYAKETEKKCRLIPFQFSTEQAYALEFGDGYMRVYKDGGRVLTADVATISGITNAVEAEVSYTSTPGSPDLVEGHWVYIYDVLGMTEVNGKYFRVGEIIAPNFKLLDIDGNPVDSTSYGTYTSGGSMDAVVEIALPYIAEDLPLLNFTQSADVLFLVHPDYPPAKLSRTAHDEWTYEVIVFGPAIDAPQNFTIGLPDGTNYFKVSAVNLSGEESNLSNEEHSGNAAIANWDAVDGASFYNMYQRIGTAPYQYAFYTSVYDTDYRINTAIIPNDKDIYDDVIYQNPFNSVNNYPGLASFFEQRLVYARTNNRPQTIWGSRIGGFTNFDNHKPLLDDDPYSFTLNAQQVNAIMWMNSLASLLIGTSGNEWKLTSGSNSDAITPTSVDIKVQSRWGSFYVQPITIGNSVVFIEASGGVVRDLAYSVEVAGYAGNDLSILSYHLLRGFNILEWTYQQHPDSVIWCVRNDGKLLGLTYQREHQIWAWSRNDTDGFFESIVSIPDETGDRHSDEVYCVVRRNLQGRMRRMVEAFRDRIPLDVYGNYDVQDSFFVDCGLSLNKPLPIINAVYDDTYTLIYIDPGYSTGLVNDSLIDIVRTQGMKEINENRYAVEIKEVAPEPNEYILKDEVKGTIRGITKATEAVVKLTNVDNYSPDNRVKISGVLGMTEINTEIGDEPYIVKEVNSSDKTITLLNVDSSNYGVYTDYSGKVDRYIDGSDFSAYTYGGEARKAVDTFTGLEHLEGKEVAILANGNVQPRQIVVNGGVMLSAPSSRVHIGLPYVSDVESLDYEYKTKTGTVQDKKRYIDSVILKLENTRSLWAGPSEDLLNELFFRTSESYGEPTKLFSGDKELSLEKSNSGGGRLFFRNIDPLPFTILSTIARITHGAY